MVAAVEVSRCCVYDALRQGGQAVGTAVLEGPATGQGKHRTAIAPRADNVLTLVVSAADGGCQLYELWQVRAGTWADTVLSTSLPPYAYLHWFALLSHHIAKSRPSIFAGIGSLGSRSSRTATGYHCLNQLN